ncbi:hypothetical protein [Streptomyces sp. NPDC093544]|uniref:hypothetical protein n=1 Tax=Streptomyces sp. NPDC093544 TaxID=3155200 RepID=UPI003426CCE0
MASTEPPARSVVGVCVGVTEGDGVAAALDEGGAEGDGLVLRDGTGAAGTGGADDTLADGDAEKDEGDPSGTLARTASGAASSREGASYAKNPLASPAAATTVTAAPATPRNTIRRRRRVGSSEGSPTPPGPAATDGTAASRIVAAEASSGSSGAATGTGAYIGTKAVPVPLPVPVPVPAPPSPGSSST